MRSSYPYTILNFKMATDIEHDGQVWLNWSWNDPYWTPNLDHWEVWPSYSYVDTNGNLRWMDMSAESVEQTNPSAREWSFYWDLPISAEEVYFRLRPIAKTKSDGSPEWEEEYYSTERKYFGGATKPDAPSAPAITQQSTLGIQVVLSLDNVLSSDNNKNVTKAEFQTIQYNSQFDTGTVLNTVQGYVDDFGNIKAFTTIGTAYGYKFRARLWAAKARTGNPDDVTVVSSDWSELTELIQGAPEKPALKINKFSATKVEYTVETNTTPHHFQFEIAPSVAVFDKVDEWERQNPSLKENSEARNAALLSFGIINEFTRSGTDPKNFQLDVSATGQDFAVYRVRAVSAETEGFYSSWSDVTDESTLIFSDGLRAPIVWSATQFAMVDDPTMQLCVMHNSPNGSPSCLCKIGWAVNQPGPFIYSEEILPPSGQSGNTVYYFNLDISSFTEETVIYWRAKTYEGNAAIEENASPLSEIKSFAIHARPTIELLFPDIPENEMFNGIPVMSTFPLKYRTETTYFESTTNKISIVSYGFKIYSKETYKTYDKLGRLNIVKAGDVLYSLLDTTTYYDIDRFLNATDVTFENGKTYIFEATVSLDNGATGTTTREFVCDFASADCVVECTHVRNDDTVALYLNPVAVKYEGGGGGVSYPDMDVINNAPAYFPNEIPVSDNNGAFKYNSETSRITFSSTREGGIGGSGEYDRYIFYTDTLDSVTGEYAPGSIIDAFAEANNMTVAEFTEFCHENEIWICCTKVKASLNRDDGYVNNCPSIILESINSGSRTLSMNNIPLLDFSVFSWETKDYIPGHEYECGCVIQEAFGMNIISNTASGINMGEISFADGTTYYVEHPIVIDEWIGLELTNPDYFGANDDATTLYFEFSMIQSARVTQEFAEEYADYEPYIGEFITRADIELGNAITLAGNIYTNPSMVTTIAMPTAGGGDTPTRKLVEDVTLSVYRKNDDGTFVKIDDNIPNNQTIYVTDPHPNLGGAEYRIVATNTEFGTTTYYDPPPIDMKCTDIILQWDEDYGNRPNNGETRDFISEMGNIVRLPYNVDVSESANMESEMVKYIGRTDPVSYYGTQTGYTATWNTEIPKYDKETIKMLRKLQVFPGDVYVREPNGTGYWAHVTVTFPINHCALTVSVSLNVTRVEGGK